MSKWEAECSGRGLAHEKWLWGDSDQHPAVRAVTNTGPARLLPAAPRAPC